MTSTHDEAYDEIKAHLDKIASTAIDFLKPEENSKLLESFNTIFDLASEYILDTTRENELLSQFVNNRNELADVYNQKLTDGETLCKELEKKLELTKKTNTDAAQRLQVMQNNISAGDFDTLIDRQEMTDRLRQWRHACDLEIIEIKNLKCKIDILDEKMNSLTFNWNQQRDRNRLFYELLSSALKVTILSIDENDNANLAVLSESKVGSEQTWHRFSSSRDCDVPTCDFMWNLIEKSLSSTKLKSFPQDPNTPKVNSIHLSPR